MFIFAIAGLKIRSFVLFIVHRFSAPVFILDIVPENTANSDEKSVQSTQIESMGSVNPKPKPEDTSTLSLNRGCCAGPIMRYQYSGEWISDNVFADHMTAATWRVPMHR